MGRVKGRALRTRRGKGEGIAPSSLKGEGAEVLPFPFTLLLPKVLT